MSDQRILNKRWCEASNRSCESTFCIENNACAQVVQGHQLSFSPQVFERAKMYNDWQIKLFAKSKNLEEG